MNPRFVKKLSEGMFSHSFRYLKKYRCPGERLPPGISYPPTPPEKKTIGKLTPICYRPGKITPPRGAFSSLRGLLGGGGGVSPLGVKSPRG